MTHTCEGYLRHLKSILGELSLTSEQLKRLQVRPRSQLSPFLESCCLSVSANVSYKHAETDVLMFTGIRVSMKTQQRLVQCHSFALPTSDELVECISVDGGSIRVIADASEQEQTAWKQYKAIQVNQTGPSMAWFQDNEALVSWAGSLDKAPVLYCLGDGHDGIWSLQDQLAAGAQHPHQILDWYHLMENLHKVPGSQQRLVQARQLLWHGQVDEVISLFDESRQHQAQCFQAYLRKHRQRIPNYAYYQAEGIPIGSGDVESLVKQIDRRTQISGARWKPEHVPQVLAHRCAYLNGQLTPTIFLSRR